jgi:hypothetical protein
MVGLIDISKVFTDFNWILPAAAFEKAVRAERPD